MKGKKKLWRPFFITYFAGCGLVGRSGSTVACCREHTFSVTTAAKSGIPSSATATPLWRRKQLRPLLLGLRFDLLFSFMLNVLRTDQHEMNILGFGLGAYQYTLKMFVYQRVRARNFARAWSFIQASQALPLVCGIPLAGNKLSFVFHLSVCAFFHHRRRTQLSFNFKFLVGYLSSEFGQEAAYYTSSAFVLIGSLALFIIDLRKYVLSRSHSHKHKHHHRKKPRTPRPATPGVASEPNTDGGGAGGLPSTGGAGGSIAGAEGIQIQPEEEDEEEDVCPPSCKVSYSNYLSNSCICNSSAHAITNINKRLWPYLCAGSCPARLVGRRGGSPTSANFVATNVFGLGSTGRTSMRSRGSWVDLHLRRRYRRHGHPRPFAWRAGLCCRLHHLLRQGNFLMFCGYHKKKKLKMLPGRWKTTWCWANMKTTSSSKRQSVSLNAKAASRPFSSTGGKHSTVVVTADIGVDVPSCPDRWENSLRQQHTHWPWAVVISV